MYEIIKLINNLFRVERKVERAGRNAGKLGKGIVVVVVIILGLAGISTSGIGSDLADKLPIDNIPLLSEAGDSVKVEAPNITSIPPFKKDYVIKLNDNKPLFTEKELKLGKKEFEKYSKLDSLGRCGVAFANISKKTIPTEKRGEIGQVKPSGWHTVKYTGLIDGNYLYNRCHLIAYCLAGENANERNLITGTRHFNADNDSGMLPYELKVAKYMDKHPNNHVLYRVTPVFKDKELVARGVVMEAYSVEDKGKGVQFCVYVYNMQPKVKIDYRTGSSVALVKPKSKKQGKKG